MLFFLQWGVFRKFPVQAKLSFTQLQAVCLYWRSRVFPFFLKLAAQCAVLLRLTKTCLEDVQKVISLPVLNLRELIIHLYRCLLMSFLFSIFPVGFKNKTVLMRCQWSCIGKVQYESWVSHKNHYWFFIPHIKMHAVLKYKSSVGK